MNQTTTNSSISNKIKGTLYGYAIGDAMGITTKSLTPANIKKKYPKRLVEIVGKGYLQLFPGEVTEETELMLLVCKALEKHLCLCAPAQIGGCFYEECCLELISWIDQYPRECSDLTKDVLKNCRELSYPKWHLYTQNQALSTPESLMLILPLVLGKQSLATMLQVIHLLCNNVESNHHAQLYYQTLQACLQGQGSDIKAPKELMTPVNITAHILNNAIYWFHYTPDFQEAILSAVNQGGISDTIAALTGSFAGAHYGYDHIPQSWIDGLLPEIRKQLDYYSDFFTQLYCP